MQTCTKCGAELIGSKKFCAACGTPVPKDGRSVPPPPTNSGVGPAPSGGAAPDLGGGMGAPAPRSNDPALDPTPMVSAAVAPAPMPMPSPAAAPVAPIPAPTTGSAPQIPRAEGSSPSANAAAAPPPPPLWQPSVSPQASTGSAPAVPSAQSAPDASARTGPKGTVAMPQFGRPPSQPSYSKADLADPFAQTAIKPEGTPSGSGPAHSGIGAPSQQPAVSQPFGAPQQPGAPLGGAPQQPGAPLGGAPQQPGAPLGGAPQQPGAPLGGAPQQQSGAAVSPMAVSGLMPNSPVPSHVAAPAPYAAPAAPVPAAPAPVYPAAPAYPAAAAAPMGFPPPAYGGGYGGQGGYGGGYGGGYTAPSPVAPGARVWVTWANGQRYPATVQQVAGNQCLVAFPDGQQHWVDVGYVSAY